MNNTDKEYFRLLNVILEKGKLKKNRTGIDTIGVFGEQAKFDIDLNAFPILTTKKVWFKGILHELLWFIKGDTNIKYLVDNDVHIWDEWAYKRYTQAFDKNDIENSAFTQQEFITTIKNNPEFAKQWGELGEGTYGGMWREFPVYKYLPIDEKLPDGPMESVLSSVDQLQKIIDKLKSNPDDRRMIVSAWHPYWVDHCALPPCHVMFHFNTEELSVEERWDILVRKDDNKYGWWKGNANNETILKTLDYLNIPSRKLNCLLYQRSCDTFLGVPFNITSYCLLTAMIAHCVNMLPGTFTHTYGDLHIYSNHLEQVKTQLSREPKKLPKLWINPDKTNLFDIQYDDVKLVDYDCHPAIKGEVAV